MSIYTPFTYIIGWSQHKKFYYGCKYAEGCQPKDLWESYFTSSNYVKEFREEFGEPDIIKIHRIFTNSTECVSFEEKFLTKIDAKNHPLFLNKHNGGKCNNFGMVIVQDDIGNVFRVNQNDPKLLSGELKSVVVNTVVVKNSEGNMFRVSCDDPKILSKEYSYVNQGKFPAVLSKTKEILHVSIEDPRWETGEIYGIRKGTVTVKDNIGNILSVSVNDPQYISGEFKPINSGMVVVKDKDGNIFQIADKDPRLLNNELKSIHKGRTNVIDKEGNIFKVSVNDSRFLSGELKSVHKGTIVAKDTSGKVYKVLKSDPRILSGELVGVNKGKRYERVTCEYCGKIIATNIYNRCHGTKCKTLIL